MEDPKEEAQNTELKIWAKIELILDKCGLFGG